MINLTIIKIKFNKYITNIVVLASFVLFNILFFILRQLDATLFIEYLIYLLAYILIILYYIRISVIKPEEYYARGLTTTKILTYLLCIASIIMCAILNFKWYLNIIISNLCVIYFSFMIIKNEGKIKTSKDIKELSLKAFKLYTKSRKTEDRKNTLEVYTLLKNNIVINSLNKYYLLQEINNELDKMSKYLDIKDSKNVEIQKLIIVELINQL